MRSAKFHFIEINWIIYFPSTGNEGRPYKKYGVAFRDRVNKVTQSGTRINLEDVVTKSEIKDNYPHTVGYYADSSGKGHSWTPEYLQRRTILNLQEFYHFLTELNI